MSPTPNLFQAISRGFNSSALAKWKPRQAALFRFLTSTIEVTTNLKLLTTGAMHLRESLEIS
jgi:hypothetical protein